MSKQITIDVTLVEPGYPGLVVLVPVVMASGKRSRLGITLADGVKLQALIDELGDGAAMKVEPLEDDKARLTLIALEDIPPAILKKRHEDYVPKEMIDGSPQVTVTALDRTTPGELEVLVLRHAEQEYELPMSLKDAARVKAMMEGEGLGKYLVLVGREGDQITLAMTPARH